MRNDDSVLGAPFQMVEFVPGRVVPSHRRTEPRSATGHTINACVDALIKVLADLHAVDPAAVGLGDFGKPDGYLERQVRRWGSQWDLVRLRRRPPRRATSGRCTPQLGEAIPPQSQTVDRARRLPHRQHDARRRRRRQGVVAVLDWEMSTLGDPLSDAALMCVYRHPTFDFVHPERCMVLAADAARRRAGRSGTRWRPASHWTTGTSTWRWPTSRWPSSAAGIALPRPAGQRRRRRRQGRRGRRSADRRRPDRTRPRVTVSPRSATWVESRAGSQTAPVSPQMLP